MSTAVDEELETKEDQKSKILPPYNVILHNDDDHSVDYVIKMMQELFKKTPEEGFQVAHEVHHQGKCIVMTTSKELAELKQEQVHAYGPDKLVARCKGSMTATIEPAR